MNPDIIDFYKAHGLLIKRIIDHGRQRGYADFEVLAALEEVYDRVQSGEQIKPINYVRTAYRIASHSAAEKYGEKLRAHARAHSDLEDARELIRGLEAKLRKRTIRKKLDNWMHTGHFK
jgi:hypothetical protein